MAAAISTDNIVISLTVAFLQTATSVCGFAWNTHRSNGDGQDAAEHDFYQHASIVREAAARLINASGSVVGAPESLTFPTAVTNLYRACCDIAKNLVIRINGTAGSQLTSVGSSFSQNAFCETWKLEDIEALGARLVQLIDQVEDLSSQTHDLKRCHRQLWPIIVDDARAGKKVLPEEAVKSLSPAELSQAEKPKIASAKDLKGLFTKHVPKANTYTAAPSILNDFILDSLAYKSMHDREDDVTRAHTDTLEWVFSPSETMGHPTARLGAHFRTWLSSNDFGPIYWITGKPGSGKSTFMQFLYQNHRTKSLLQSWAGDRSVLTASFFFWTSGSGEQRSHTGLLRYLLHQMLSSCPEYMPKTFPSLWKKLSAMSTKERIQLTLDFTILELQNAFHAFMDAALRHMKVCFFVDGMDEFEGDHATIIDFFRDLSMRNDGKDVKMCLSSRPWKVFEQAFQHQVPNLRLQDLTFEDMRTYVADRLRGETFMRKESGALFNELAEEVVKRADGVFLWARLAVNKLLDDFTALPEEFDALSSLAVLPSDLYQLFDLLIFQCQTSTEVSQTSILFQLIKAREVVADFVKNDEGNSLTVWEHTFALSTETIPDVVVEVSDEKVIEWGKNTTRLIDRRFSRLVEQYERRDKGNIRTRFDMGTSLADSSRRLAENRVTFIHRTVRDWLMYEPGVEERLLQQSPNSYDAHLQLLRSYVLRLKHPLEAPEQHRRLDEWYPDIALAMTHARYITNDPLALQRPLLNELNNTLSWYWLHKPKDPYDHWARNTFGQYEVRMKAAPIFQPFLCLAAKFQLTRYLSEELVARSWSEPSELEDDQAVPLLSYATEFLCSRNKTIFPTSDPDLISFLLHHRNRLNPGPNHEYTDFTSRRQTTPWLAVLKHLRDAQRRGWIEYYDTSEDGVARWVTVVEAFLEAESDKGAVIERDRWDPEATALEVITLIESVYADHRIATLRQHWNNV